MPNCSTAIMAMSVLLYTRNLCLKHTLYKYIYYIRNICTYYIYIICIIYMRNICTYYIFIYIYRMPNCFDIADACPRLADTCDIY